MSWSTVRVPASSANLGPGFDALGMALGLHLECRFRKSDQLSIEVSGRDRELIPSGPDNLIWQTALAVAEKVRLPMPAIELRIENQIPLGKGLGSSAAALTAGVARAVRLELPARFGVGIVVPDFVLPTSKAREVLPHCYGKEDVVFNVQRAALLIAALATGSTTAFPAALEDRLHQPYRLPLVPGLEDILKLRAPGLLGCALSGAGPSIVVFYERGYDQVCDLVRQVFGLHGHAAEVLLTDIAAAAIALHTESGI